ncbi:MAG: efflux system, outer rane lipoprotein NodT [Nitrosospira multiformis]|nr:efflux system, outer rane lipoprotein NodT [Nitrosospira multiformis]
MRSRLTLLAFLLPLVLVLQSCMFGPNYRWPEVEAMEKYRFDFGEKVTRDIADTAWWEQFGDPILNELIRIALVENKDIRIAAARIEEFQGRYGATRSELFPQIGGDAAAERRRSTAFIWPRGLGGDIDPYYSYYQVSINANWELDIWGRIRRLSEAARHQLFASEAARRATILTLVTSVASSYINLLILDRQLEIARATAATRRETLDVFRLRYEGGVISQLELAQIESQYETAVAAIPALESSIAQQENALAVLLGRNPGPIARGRELAKLELPMVSAGLPSELLMRRPDLREAEQNLISANAQIGAARALYFPRISLTGVLGVASTQLATLFTGPAYVAAFGVLTSVPIFTAGGIAGQVKQAEARHEQALVGYQRAIQIAFREVEDSLIAVQKTRAELAAQTRRVEALRTYLEMAQLRYDEGYISFIEVLDAQRSLFEAETTQAQTRGRVFISLVDLYKSLGGGWVVEADRIRGQMEAGSQENKSPPKDGNLMDTADHERTRVEP